MKRLSKNTNINKGQEVPRVNLNLQTKAAQYLVHKVKPKKEVGGKAAKRSSF